MIKYETGSLRATLSLDTHRKEGYPSVQGVPPKNGKIAI